MSSHYLNFSQHVEKIIYLIVVICSFLFSFKSFINPQLFGEDEASTFLLTSGLLNNLKELNFFNFFKSLLGSYHPPARYILPIPFIEVFGENIISMRIPYFILWIASCALVTKIAFVISGKFGALITGLFLAISGLFNLEIQSLSHGATVFFGLLLISELLKHDSEECFIFNKKKALIKINIYLLLGFLFFTSWSVIIFGFYLFLTFRLLKRKDFIKNITQLFLITLPFFLFYIIYYIIFLGFPYWLINFNGVEIFNLFFNKNIQITNEPFGQLYQNFYRVNNAGLNINGFIENIKTLNWAYLPIIGPILFFLGLVNIFKNKRNIFYTIIIYFLLFNFYFSGNTGQHIQTLFIMLFAFSINEMIALFKSKFFFKYFVILKIVLLIFFTYIFHLRDYNEKNFPYEYESLFFATSKWPQNLHRPLDEIVFQLSNFKKNEKPVLNLIDGAVSLYHGKELKWIYKKDIEGPKISKENCYVFDSKNYRAAVSSKKLKDFCYSKSLEFIEFENSNLYILIHSQK